MSKHRTEAKHSTGNEGRHNKELWETQMIYTQGNEGKGNSGNKSGLMKQGSRTKYKHKRQRQGILILRPGLRHSDLAQTEGKQEMGGPNGDTN